MSVDNVTVSLSRLALAKAIKTPDTDDAEPWTNSVIFHQAHIPTRMRERVENPQPAVQAQTSHRPLAHTHHHRQHHQQQLMRRSMIMERSSHDSRHSKIPDRNFKPSADRGSKSRVQHPAPSDDEDEEEEEEDSDDGSQDEDEQGDEIEKRTDARRMSTLRQLERGSATNHSLHQRSRSAGDMDMLHQQKPQQKRSTQPVTTHSPSSSSSSAGSSGTRTPPLTSSMIPARAMTPNSKPQYSHLHPQPRANAAAAAANAHHRRSTGNMDSIMSSAQPVVTPVQPRAKPASRPVSTIYNYHPQQQELYRRSMDIDMLYQQQQQQQQMQMQQQMQPYPQSMYSAGTNVMLRPAKQHRRPSSDLLTPPQRQSTPQPALSYYSPQPPRHSMMGPMDGVQQQDHRHKKPQKSRHQRNGSHTHVSGASGYVYDQTSTNARRRAEMRRMDPVPTQTRSTPQPSYNMMPMAQQAYLPATYAYPNYY